MGVLNDRNRFPAWAWIVSLALGMVVLVAWFPSAATGMHQGQPEYPALVGKSLEIVDSTGRPRLRLSTEENGHPSIILLDSFGKERVSLALNAIEDPILKLTDGSGRGTIQATVRSQIKDRIVTSRDNPLYGAKVQTVQEVGTPIIVLIDSEGVARILDGK